MVYFMKILRYIYKVKIITAWSYHFIATGFQTLVFTSYTQTDSIRITNHIAGPRNSFPRLGYFVLNFALSVARFNSEAAITNHDSRSKSTLLFCKQNFLLQSTFCFLFVHHDQRLPLSDHLEPKMSIVHSISQQAPSLYGTKFNKCTGMTVVFDKCGM